MNSKTIQPYSIIPEQPTPDQPSITQSLHLNCSGFNPSPGPGLAGNKGVTYAMKLGSKSLKGRPAIMEQGSESSRHITTKNHMGFKAK